MKTAAKLALVSLLISGAAVFILHSGTPQKPGPQSSRPQGRPEYLTFVVPSGPPAAMPVDPAAAPVAARADELQSDSELTLRLGQINAEISKMRYIELANEGRLDTEGRARLLELLRQSNSIHKTKTLRLLAQMDRPGPLCTP
jgi:hypothetical protein